MKAYNNEPWPKTSHRGLRAAGCTLVMLVNGLVGIMPLRADTTSGLVAYWPFDEISGTNVLDLSGYGNHARLAGNAVRVPSRPGLGSALALDGSSAEATVTNSPSLNPSNAITIAAWLRAAAPFSSNRILQKGIDDNQYALRFSPTNTVFELRGTTVFQLIAQAPPPGEWHHLAGTYDGTNMNLYLDGTLVASQSSSGQITESPDPVAIGNKPLSIESVDHFNGLLDDIRIYERALTAVDVRELVGPTFAVPGHANPWLAGMPAGSTAGTGQPCPLDSAPADSPVMFEPVVAGSVMTFHVTGSTDHGADPYGPDGGPIQPHPAENGMSSNNLPISALVGVFLDSLIPDLTPVGECSLFEPGAPIISPHLKEVFFIGDGLTGNGDGVAQQFVVPAGASRLFLGTQDGCGWANNGGSFQVVAELYPQASIRVSQVEVCWGSLSNMIYQVQFRTALTSNAWLDLGPVLPGTGAIQCITDSVIPGQPSRFYRVVTLP